MRILNILAILAVICCTFAVTSFAGGPSMNIDFAAVSVARLAPNGWMPIPVISGTQTVEIGDVVGLWITNSATPGKTYGDVQWAQAPVTTPKGYFGVKMGVRSWTASKVGRSDIYCMISEESTIDGFQSRSIKASLNVVPKSLTFSAYLTVSANGAATLTTIVYNRMLSGSYFAPRVDVEMVSDRINIAVFSDRNAQATIVGKAGLEYVKNSGRMTCSWTGLATGMDITDMTATKCSLRLPTIPAGGRIATTIKLAPIVLPPAPVSYTYEVMPVDSNGSANGPAVMPNALGYRILAVGQHYKVFAHIAGKLDSQLIVLMGNRYNGEYPLRTLVSISDSFWCVGEGGGTMFITLNDKATNAKIVDFPFNIYAVDESQTGGK
jgi:hypothetical protein